MSDQDQPQPDDKISRGKLLASPGITGVALAAGGEVFNSIANAVKETITDAVYSNGQEWRVFACSGPERSLQGEQLYGNTFEGMAFAGVRSRRTSTVSDGPRTTAWRPKWRT
jgi:hypothetical protein